MGHQAPPQASRLSIGVMPSLLFCPPSQHLPSRALAIFKARRKQSLEYVLPLQPQTGWRLLLLLRATQIRGSATHEPPPDAHIPAGGSHHNPLSQTDPARPSHGWPTETACDRSCHANAAASEAKRANANTLSDSMKGHPARSWQRR